MNKFLTIAIIICAAAIAASVWLPGYLSKGGTEDGAGMGPSDGPVVIDGRGEVLSYIQGDRSGKAGESMRDFAAKGIVSGRVTERPSEPRVSPEEAKKIAAAQQAAQHLSIGISKLESLCVPAGTGKEAKTKLATDIVKNSGMYISNCNINGSKHRRIPEDPSKTVTLGAYPQNGQEPEPIEWLVVAVSGRDLYVVSKYVLERRAFEETDRNAAWKDCSLRKWLNGEFFDTAFSAEDKKRILTAEVTSFDEDITGRRPPYKTAVTEDRVFIPCVFEHEYFFYKDRTCMPTKRARDAGVSTRDNGILYCYWWLRGGGPGAGCMNIVQSRHWDADADYMGVRPAMWIRK